MKTTLDLPEEIVREMKLRAVLQRRPLKDLAADLLRQGLGMAPPSGANLLPANSRIQIDAHGLPVIPGGPDAPASRMSVEELLALEQEALAAEDLQRAGLSL